jgi:hypothetical protein
MRMFIALKYTSPWPGSNPQSLGSVGSTLPTTSPRRPHGWTSLDELSARCRGLCLHRTTQYINTRENIHALSRNRTRYPSKQAAAGLRLRPRGHRYRHHPYLDYTNILWTVQIIKLIIMRTIYTFTILSPKSKYFPRHFASEHQNVLKIG